jgi:hypothetical protein
MSVNIERGLNAVNIDAVNIESGLNAVNIERGLNAVNIESGLNAMNMESGLKSDIQLQLSMLSSSFSKCRSISFIMSGIDRYACCFR